MSIPDQTAVPADVLPTAERSPRQQGEGSMFTGRVAIVTGGTRGIGGAIAATFVESGARVAAGFHKNREAAESFRADLQDRLQGGASAVSLHQGSVADPADCARVVQEVIDTHGGVDYLINNAGVTADKTVRKMGADDWNIVVGTNLTGAFYMTSAVLDHMLERGHGRIVNISSVIGQTGNVGQANYAASKAGLVGFTKSLALETAEKGITVNCIAPGFIQTDMVVAMPEKVREGLVERIPMRRLGRPSEVARIARFLCEEDTSYITGAVVSVNGGLEM